MKKQIALSDRIPTPDELIDDATEDTRLAEPVVAFCLAYLRLGAKGLSRGYFLIVDVPGYHSRATFKRVAVLFRRRGWKVRVGPGKIGFQKPR